MDRLTFDGNFCDIVMVFHALKEEGKLCESLCVDFRR